MPHTGKSLVWKIKAICTILQGFAVQRDITRTRDACFIYTYGDKNENCNDWDTKRGHKHLILIVRFFHAFQVNTAPICIWVSELT
jgi:hypothetical protein